MATDATWRAADEASPRASEVFAAIAGKAQPKLQHSVTSVHHPAGLSGHLAIDPTVLCLLCLFHMFVRRLVWQLDGAKGRAGGLGGGGGGLQHGREGKVIIGIFSEGLRCRSSHAFYREWPTPVPHPKIAAGPVPTTKHCHLTRQVKSVQTGVAWHLAEQVDEIA